MGPHVPVAVCKEIAYKREREREREALLDFRMIMENGMELCGRQTVWQRRGAAM